MRLRTCWWLFIPINLQEDLLSSAKKALQLWDGDQMLSPFGTPLNPEQVAATIDRELPLVLEASAGAGKTLVLVERFVRDVLEGGNDGVPLGCDEILAITFTRKAAAELRGRIRNRFVQLADSNERAREAVAQLDTAWISTIDSFCARLLRRHALLVGVDPQFGLIDEIELRIFRREAFRRAAERVTTGADAAKALDLLAAEGFDTVMQEIGRIYEKLRSAGAVEPRLPLLSKTEDASRWTTILDDLLVTYGEEFAAVKRANSGSDFADVAFATRTLLIEHPKIAASYRERFKRVLIDEFQDTNRLQLELFAALGVPAQFQVGDPLQSIYGFRNADLDVFLEVASEHETRDRKRRLTTSYRARPEILATINGGFSGIHDVSGIDWAAIEGGNDKHALGPTPLVELLFTETESWAESDLSPGDAEARLVASRIKQLIDSGEATSGEIVILMETRTKMGLFRSELERLGIDAVADGGEDWWNQIELVDLLNHLRLVANRSDEEALLGALRSPICGISLDALALIGAQNLADPEMTLWKVFGAAAAGDLGDGYLAALDSQDLERLRSYRSLFAGWESVAGALGVGALLERMIAEGGYVSLLLGGPDGKQRVANVRRFLAIAQSFERRHGSDLRRFLTWVSEASAGRSEETDAPIGGDVDGDGDSDPRGPIRLMTIHSAKGLEYPVVVVPCLGRLGRTDSSMIRVDGDKIGCALRCAGTSGDAEPLGALDELKSSEEREKNLERRRTIHVAITRAERRLILSGVEKASANWSLDEMETKRSCLVWIVPGLLGENASEILKAGGDQVLPVSSEYGEGELKLIVNTPDRTDDLFAKPVESKQKDKAVSLEAIPVPSSAVAAPSVATISYSLLARVAECPYRWYLENVVGLPPREDDGFSDGSLGARARGTLTHQLLEQLKFEQGESAPSDHAIAAVAASVDGANSDSEAIKDQRRMLEAFIGSEVWQRLAASNEVERESSFALEIVAGDGTLPVLIGTIDALAEGPDGRVLVVDYKTDTVTPDEDLDLKVESRYGLQRDAYALAALRRGAQQVEVVHCFLQRPDQLVSVSFTADQEGELVERLRIAAETVTKSEFPVSDRPHRGLCIGCPGRPVGKAPGLCSHSDAETSRAL